MKVLVLNGSPTGKNSITLYTVLYIQKHFPECEFEILQVGAQIKGMEKEFTDCAQKLEAADLILGMKLVGMMMRNQKLQKKMGGKMTEGMIMPYQKVLKS